WIHRAALRTKRGVVGTTSRTVLIRQELRPKQSNRNFVSLRHPRSLSPKPRRITKKRGVTDSLPPPVGCLPNRDQAARRSGSSNLTFIPGYQRRKVPRRSP